MDSSSPGMGFRALEKIIREASPIAISILFNLIYFKLDTLILQHYHGDAATGIYGAPYKVLEVLTSIPAMFAGLLTPILSQSFASGDRVRFQMILQRGTDVMAMIAVPMIVGGILLERRSCALLPVMTLWHPAPC